MRRDAGRILAAIIGLGAAWTFAPPAEAQLGPQLQLKANSIPQFVEPLPTLNKGIPLTGGSSVEVSVCEFQTSILPAGALGKRTPAPLTWVWGYRVGRGCPQGPVSDSYIGPVVVAQHKVPTEMTYYNQLGDAATTNVIAYKQSVDQTVVWADPLNGEANECADQAMKNPGQPPSKGCADLFTGPIAVAPHLHGGEISAPVDGGPDAWWTKSGYYGHGYYSAGGLKDASEGKATYVYANSQEPAPTWFHDHVLGATRLNVYAGIAGAYIQVDPKANNPNYPAQPNLPGAGEIIPIVLQDRMFDTNGQLLMPAVGLNPEHPYWVPEFVGDVIVVNGKAWPYLDVQPKRYRFLFLNGSNARAYELFLINKATNIKGPVMWVIGTDQGYLDKPVKIDPNELKPEDKLVIMPGERYEVIIDFSAAAGAQIMMGNTAKTPYPFGEPVDGSTTGRIMEFRIAPGSVKDDSFDPAAPAAMVRVPDALIHRFVDPLTGTKNPELRVQKVRRLTLNEAMGPGGPLEVLVNNTRYGGDDPARSYEDFEPIRTKGNTTYYSELPQEGETELWEIVNITADAHPIHPHLVAFQVLNRQRFNARLYTAAYDASFPGGLYLPGFGPPAHYTCGGATVPARGDESCVLGGNPDPAPFFVTDPLSGVVIPPRPPRRWEVGWKDTAISYPGEVLRLLVRFGPTTFPPDADPSKVKYAFDPGGGHGYVWHCHIIDHEDNEMMRPMSVQSLGGHRDFVLPQPSTPLP